MYVRLIDRQLASVDCQLRAMTTARAHPNNVTDTKNVSLTSRPAQQHLVGSEI